MGTQCSGEPMSTFPELCQLRNVSGTFKRLREKGFFKMCVHDQVETLLNYHSDAFQVYQIFSRFCIWHRRREIYLMPSNRGGIGVRSAGFFLPL